jgi:hypothetical protein
MTSLTILPVAVLAFAAATMTTPAFAGIPLNGTSLDGIAEDNTTSKLNGVDVTGVIITPKSSRVDQSAQTPPIFEGLAGTNGTSLNGIAEDNAASKLNGVDLVDVLLRR